MTQETKKRLQERFQQLLDSTDESPRTLFEIEKLTIELSEKLTQATLEEISRDAQEQAEEEISPTELTSKVCCPDCSRSAWYKGNRSRRVVTKKGILCFTRRYYYCKRCQHGFCPLDNRLGLSQKSDFTPLVVQEVAYLCACLPFEQATQILYRLAGVKVSARSAERLCLSQADEQSTAFREQRDTESLPLAFVPSSSLPASLPHPEVLYIEADGVQTPLRGGQWHAQMPPRAFRKEMKVGVVRSEHKDGREDKRSRYVNYLGNTQTFGSRLESLARAKLLNQLSQINCGSLTANVVVFLGDGAAWLWNLAQIRFPKAVQILDFWHAFEYLGKVAREVFPDQEVCKDAWLTARASEMKKSAWTQVHCALEAVRAIASESVESAVRYFTNNRSRMDYANYLKRGLCIGSGLAESSCKRLVTQRLKGSGMHWSEKGAQAICSLRSLLLGGEWDVFLDFWNRRLQMLIPSPLS